MDASAFANVGNLLLLLPPKNTSNLSAQSLSRGIAGGGIRMQPRTNRPTRKFRWRSPGLSPGVIESKAKSRSKFSMQSIKRGVCRRMKAPCQSGQSPPAIHGEVNVFSANRAAGQLAIRNAQTPATVVGAPRGQPTLD